MSQHRARDYWKSIAVDVEDIEEHPGYRYKFCRSFDEFDAIMKSEVGPGWRQTDWARYLAQGDSLDIPNVSIEKVNRDKMPPAQVTNPFVASRNNYESLCRELIQKGVTDVNTLYEIVRTTTTKYRVYAGSEEYTYKPTKAAIQSFVRKYSRRNRRPTRLTPVYIIAALIKHYANEGRSLREIAYKLNKNEGIKLSHERIRELAEYKHPINV